MRLNKEALATRVVVRRARRGAAPFVWEINMDNRIEPIYVSPEAYGCMESAYKAGQARLRDLVANMQAAPAEVDGVF